MWFKKLIVLAVVVGAVMFLKHRCPMLPDAEQYAVLKTLTPVGSI
jgi:hypothetical protein